MIHISIESHQPTVLVWTVSVSVVIPMAEAKVARVARVEKMARVAKEAKVAKVERGVKVVVEPKATVANNNNPDGLKVIATVVEHTDGCNAIVLLATTIGWRLWRRRRSHHKHNPRWLYRHHLPKPQPQTYQPQRRGAYRSVQE